MRPIVEIMTVNFSLLALDQIVNNAATLLHMSGGQFNVPLVIRMATGARAAARGAALAQPRGLVRAHPGHQGARARHARGRARHALRRALADPEPGADLRARAALQHRGRARRRRGRRSTIDARARCAGAAATSRWSPTAARSARRSPPPRRSPREGIEAEVLDLRALRPLDDGDDPRRRSRARTAR